MGRKFIAHCDQYARGRVKFVDKAVVAVEIKKVSEGKPKEREELDEPELAGTDEDPWVFQRYLPLEDPDTGEVLVFVSKSVGGKIALSDLLACFERNWDRGRPIVKLATGTSGVRREAAAGLPGHRVDRRWPEGGRARGARTAGKRSRRSGLRCSRRLSMSRFRRVRR